jgi:hypothetical protein
MNNYLPALDATRLLPGGVEDHRAQLVRLLLQVRKLNPDRRGITAEVALQEERAAEWLVEALCQASAHLPPVALALPRSRGAYTASAQRRVPFPYGVITRVLEACRSLGWIEEITGNEERGVTRLLARGELRVYCGTVSGRWRRRPAPPADELLVIGNKVNKNKIRRRVTDQDHVDAARWRSNLDAINQFLAEQCIYLRATNAEMGELSVELGKPDKDGNPRMINFGRVALRRIFSETLDKGGRFYGGWWQNAPSHARRFIFINEWRGIECDYSGMALRCVYADEGLTPPDDPYDIALPGYMGRDDPRREFVKDFINAILNDRKKQHRMASDRLAALGMTQAQLMGRIEQVHAPINHHLRTDAGLRMQFTDSEIAERVMLKLMARNIVCLPIHDSFIVPAPFMGELQAAMESSFEEVTGQPARLEWSVPPFGEHFADQPLTPADIQDEASLRARMADEIERYSLANEYFASWVDQQFGPAGWQELEAKLDQFVKAGMSRSFFRFHAFPLPLLLGRGK